MSSLFKLLSLVLIATISMAAQIPTPTHLKNADEVVSLLSPRLEQIRQSRMVYYWQVASPRDRLPFYCIDQCACLVREFAKELHKNNIDYEVVSVNFIPRKGTEVRLRTYKSRSESYVYHKAIAVDIGGELNIIDPIAIGNTKPEPYSKWKTRIEDVDRKIITFTKWNLD